MVSPLRRRLRADQRVGSASPPHALLVYDVSWTLSQLAKVAQLTTNDTKFTMGNTLVGPLSPHPKGSGASSGGRTTLKKEARSSHSFHQKDGFARIVLDKRITERTHEVGAIGCD
ncbi:hypothetical protein Tco_1322514 [Tanacetum coccineum]